MEDIVLGWPQWTVLAIWAIGLITWGALHGQLPQWRYNVGSRIVGIIFSAIILYCGGFFTH